MIIFLFGKPGTGKNFIGDLIAENFNFYHYDADKDIPRFLVEKIRSGQLATDEERIEFYNIVINNLNSLKIKYQNIVVSQALVKEKFRKMMIDYFPEIKFIYVQADKNLVAKRLLEREHFVSKKYVDELEIFFEEPKVKHFILENNGGVAEIIKQIKKLIK